MPNKDRSILWIVTGFCSQPHDITITRLRPDDFSLANKMQLSHAAFLRIGLATPSFTFRMLLQALIWSMRNYSASLYTHCHFAFYAAKTCTCKIDTRTNRQCNACTNDSTSVFWCFWICEAVAYSAFEIIGGAAAAGVFKITHEARS